MRGRRECDRGHYAENGLGPLAWSPSPSSSSSSPSPWSSTSSTASTMRPTPSRPSCPPACSLPTQAVVWAAFFNFVAAFGFGADGGTHTIGKGIVRPESVDALRNPRRADRRDHVEPDHLVRRDPVQLLARAHRWTGGGRRRAAGFGESGSRRTGQGGSLHRPRRRCIGLAVGVRADARRALDLPPRLPGRVDRLFRRLQLVSAAVYSLGHGTNDAQKTMGIIAGLLFATGHLGPEFRVPVVGDPVRACGDRAGDAGRRLADRQDDGHGDHPAAPGGRLLRGDRRVAAAHRHRGRRDPVSTTHTITGAIVGVGATTRSPPCAGASRDGSSGPGFSRSRRRRSSPG